MSRPQKGVVYAADASPLGDLATALQGSTDQVMAAALRVHNTVYNFDWEGRAHEAALDRADYQLVQDHRVGSAEHTLADAYQLGAATLVPMIDGLKSDGQGLESDCFEVSEDWVVTDAYDYAAARLLLQLMGSTDEEADDVLGAVKTARTEEATTATVRLQRLADELGVADQDTAAAIGKAKAELAYAAPEDGESHVRLVGDQRPADPTINNDASTPQPENRGDDLDATIPNTGINIGGDGANHRPFLNGQPNPLDANDGTRPLPTGTAAGPNGQQLAFYSQPPYEVKNPDGSTVGNPSFVTPNSAIVDLANPSRIIGHAPVAQASGAYDKNSNTMFVVGNPGDGHGATRQLWQSDPIDPNNPNAWTNNWHYVGDVMSGNRENQMIALQGGGFLLTGASDGDSIRGVTAATPFGLVGRTQGDILVANGPSGVVNVYGPTVVTDYFDAATGTDAVQLRVSQYGPPDQPDLYDPQTFTSTFTVSQPRP